MGLLIIFKDANVIYGVILILLQGEDKILVLIIQQKKYKVIEMRIVIQLIQNYLKQEIPTLLISTENNKYLFNVPSSYQRFTREHKTKMPSGAHYFFTKSNTATITGLTGILLTLYDGGQSCRSKLYTDQKIFNYIEELRYKMGFKVAPISYCSWNGRLRKGINNITTIHELSKREDFKQIFDNLDKHIDLHIPPEDHNNAFFYYDINNATFKNEQIKIIPFMVEECGETITNYIIQPGALPGRIISEKLKEFGLKGKAINQITAKGQVTVNGRIIKIGQIREPDCPSPNVLLLHYKYPQTIQKILKNERLMAYLSDKNNRIHAIFHIVQQPQTVLHPSFKLLLSCFSTQTEHVVYNRKFKNSTDSLEDLISLSSQVRLVSSLHAHFPLCMPNLMEKHLQYVSEYVGKTEAIDSLFPQFKVRAYKRCHEMVIAPKKSWGYKQVGGAQKKALEINPQITNLNVNQQLSEQEKLQFTKIDPKIVFLGTGSMKPSKHRNVSSILVEWSPKDFIMLDCGQGSHIQIADHYGYQRYQQILLSIRVIFNTHIHSDHNLGILDLISQRTRILKQRKMDLNENKLFLVLPANVVPWYNSFCQNIENLNQGCQVIFIQALRNEQFSFDGTMSKENMMNRTCSVKSEMVEESEEDLQSQDQDQLNFIKPQWNNILRSYFERHEENMEKFKTYLKTINVAQFYPCPVIHCPQSYGIVIKHSSGVKVSYSGDTRPCIEFAKAAEESTVMIHQATFGNDLQDNAISHYHSTVDQAISIGMASKSWKLALTHFSQRYKSASQIVDPSLYKLNKVKQQFSEKHTIVCFDHFEMNCSQAHIMPAYSRALAKAIPSESKE